MTIAHDPVSLKTMVPLGIFVLAIYVTRVTEIYERMYKCYNNSSITNLEKKIHVVVVKIWGHRKFIMSI